MKLSPTTTLTEILAYLQGGGAIRGTKLKAYFEQQGLDNDFYKRWQKDNNVTRRPPHNNDLEIKPTAATPAPDLTKPLTHAHAKDILEGMKGKAYRINGRVETVKGYLFKGLGSTVIIDTNLKMRSCKLTELHTHLREYEFIQPTAEQLAAITQPFTIPVAKSEIEVNAPVTSAPAVSKPPLGGLGVAFRELTPANTIDKILPATLTFRYGRMHLNSGLTNLLKLTATDTIKFYQHPDVAGWYIAKAADGRGWPLFKGPRSYGGFNCDSLGAKREIFTSLSIVGHKKVFNVSTAPTPIATGITGYALQIA